MNTNLPYRPPAARQSLAEPGKPEADGCSIMKQEQLTEAWNLLATKAVVWGWDSRRYGTIQTLIKDGRFVWSRKAPADREPGAWQELQMTPEDLARAMQALNLT